MASPPSLVSVARVYMKKKKTFFFSFLASILSMTETRKTIVRTLAFFRRLLPGRRGPRVEVRGRLASAGAGGRQDKQTSAFAPLLFLSAPGSSVPQAAAACVSVSHDFRRPISQDTSDIGDWVVGVSDPSRRRVDPRRSILADWNRRSESIPEQREECRSDVSKYCIRRETSRERNAL